MHAWYQTIACLNQNYKYKNLKTATFSSKAGNFNSNRLNI